MKAPFFARKGLTTRLTIKLTVALAILVPSILAFQNCGQFSTEGQSKSSASSLVSRSDSTKYFGYYNYYHGAQDYPSNTRYSNFQNVRDHANVVFIHLNDIHYRDRIIEAHRDGMGVVIDIGNLFYKTNLNPLFNASQLIYYKDKTELSETLEADWNALVEFLRPYRNSVVAFYDEEPYWSAAYHQATPTQQSILTDLRSVNSNLARIATTIETTYPEIPYAVVDEGLSFAGLFLLNGVNQPLQMCAACREAIRIPNNVDWLGFEGEYPETQLGFQNWEGFSMLDYLNFTKAKLSSNHQKLVIVPPSFVSTPQTATQYSDMVKVTDAFFNLALQEPRLVAVFPYFWYAPADQRGRVGLLDQTRADLRNAFRDFAKCFRSGFQGPLCSARAPLLASILAGPFRSAGLLYYSNGAHHYCSYTDMAHYLREGNNPNVDQITQVALIPGNMIRDGVCNQ